MMNLLKLRLFVTGILLTFISLTAFSQEKDNWQNLDFRNDSVMGVSVERAYKELLKGKRAKTVIVAVLDGGVEVQHEDLKKVIFKNRKDKINGKDDDNNGYIDDYNGWNFLGKGDKDINYETLEIVRQIRKLSEKFASTTMDSASKAMNPDYQKLMKMEAEYIKDYNESAGTLANIEALKGLLEQMEAKIGKENLNAEGFGNYKPADQREAQAKAMILNVINDGMDYKSFKEGQIDDGYDHYYQKVHYNLNLNYDGRAEIGLTEEGRFYGNNHVKGPDALHGTHVAGIIAANRKNKLGIKGIADNVKILGVRTVPNGDENDYDVANAIRYATDMGAKVINMSFGKSYSDNKKVVDDAVKYAVSKDVLLVHAAGNSNKNLDQEKNFPNRKYEGNNGFASSWIEVGASGPQKDESLKASFSNYGKASVDVFAPGVNIYSTTPDSEYRSLNGTSMAAPVVSGVAALIRSYYPNLTAVQVKQIILDSSVKVNQEVKVLVDDKPVDISFTDLSISGGIINAYNALKLADEISKTGSSK